ncbi:nucleotide pyrophosphohydrolase [Corynebacterium sp. H113]|uniref:nucleotide pyrophosphohydrolase n=1 Tax=Corynebacterium sp. H113 TaxID=3133419 RepID=UPI00309CC663
MLIDEVLEELRQFTKERDWGKFHSPENLAKGISIEAAELLECFQWSSEYEKEDVRLELADILTYCYLLSDKLGEDPNSLVLEKLSITKKKYPIEQSKGIATKYSKLRMLSSEEV